MNQCNQCISNEHQSMLSKKKKKNVSLPVNDLQLDENLDTTTYNRLKQSKN